MEDFLFPKRGDTDVVAIRLTKEEQKKVLGVGKKQGIKKLGTICAALVRYSLNKIEGKE